MNAVIDSYEPIDAMGRQRQEIAYELVGDISRVEVEFVGFIGLARRLTNADVPEDDRQHGVGSVAPFLLESLLCLGEVDGPMPALTSAQRRGAELAAKRKQRDSVPPVLPSKSSHGCG